MMRDPVGLAIRRAIARTEAAERRLAQTVLRGKVAETDSEKRRIRLKLGVSAEGKDVLSPWLPWQEAGVGALSIHGEPAIGEQMIMLSPSGTIGAGSIALRGSYDRDHAAPSKSSDTAVIAAGKGRIELGPEGIRLIGHVRASGGVLTHDDIDVGKGHEHTKVLPGGGLSGPPKT